MSNKQRHQTMLSIKGGTLDYQFVAKLFGDYARAENSKKVVRRWSRLNSAGHREDLVEYDDTEAQLAFATLETELRKRFLLQFNTLHVNTDFLSTRYELWLTTEDEIPVGGFRIFQW